MLKKISIGLAVVVVGFVSVAAMQPADFRLSRTATISASPEKIYGLITDFHKWDGWSPWAKIDPKMKQTFEGAASGTGAVYTWSGNDQAGEGKMTIGAVEAPNKVAIQLEFTRPFAAVNGLEFTMKASGTGTVVEWTMTGRNNLMAKAFTIFMPMEKMVGPDFEKGLAQLKSMAETSAHI